MKKLLSILVSLMLLLTMLPLGAVSVSAGTYGDLTYTISNGEVTITGYTDALPADVVIPDTIEGYPVTTIGDDAFQKCPLTSVSIPNSIITIGNGAFANCALLSVIIPDSVTSIGKYAFSGSQLNSVTLGAGITSMDHGAFMSCYSLSAISIPVNVIDLDFIVSSLNLTDVYYGGTEEDRNNTNLYETDPLLESTWHYNTTGTLIDPEHLNYIINNNQVRITGFVDELPANAIIPSTIKGFPVTEIGGYAFYSCRSLSSVIIPNSVVSIGDSAFRFCTNLNLVTIGAGVTAIAADVFQSCISLTTINVAANNPNYSSYDGMLLDKGANTLLYCPDSKEGTCFIPNSVTFIEETAFNDCRALTAFEADENNNSYCSADGVLFNKDKTTLIRYPAQKNDSTYIVPDSVISFSHYAFQDCSYLESLTVPNSVVFIEDDAFCGCYTLTDIYYDGTEEDRANIAINSDNDYLLNATWHYAPPKSLLYEIVNGEVTITGYTDELPADVIIPDTVEGYPVTAIGDNAFLECPLNSVIIPNSVTTIGSCAFSYSGLYEIFIPVGVTDIDPEAFHACAISFTVDENNRYYSAMDGILFNKDQTTIVACGMLWSYEYTVPDTVTTIGQFAFFGASIESLIIPVSVVSIEDYAFATARITDVYYGGTVTDRANIAVGSFNNDRLLNATWHYHYGQSHTYDHDFDADCNDCDDIREVNLPITFGGNSVSEDVSGLAFKFDVDVLGMAVINGTTAVYDNATIDGFRLIKMGALVSNSKSEIDIEAVYLCDLEADSVSYAVRIINIPAENYDSVITAIPYFVVEIDGVVTTIYGEVQTTTFNNVKN